jgi:osmotically-inducible protein OsmY
MFPMVMTLAALLSLGAGTVGAATNEEVEKSIGSALVEKLGDDAKTIRVAFYDGKATLSGKVKEDSTMELAKEVALWVPGVNKVENEIESATNRAFGSGKVLDESKDTALENEVKNALNNEIGRDSSGIEVEACAGFVSLRGTVPDKERHDRAMATATKYKGVEKVIDLLRLPG